MLKLVSALPVAAALLSAATLSLPAHAEFGKPFPITAPTEAMPFPQAAIAANGRTAFTWLGATGILAQPPAAVPSARSDVGGIADLATVCSMGMRRRHLDPPVSVRRSPGGTLSAAEPRSASDAHGPGGELKVRRR
jgi:hypothetical protein